MKASELRSMTREELEHELEELREEEFRLRLRRPTEELPNALKLRTIGRDIARILTVLREDKRGIIHLPTKSAQETAKGGETKAKKEALTEKTAAGKESKKKTRAKRAPTKKVSARKVPAKKTPAKKTAPKKKPAPAKPKTTKTKAKATKESGK